MANFNSFDSGAEKAPKLEITFQSATPMPTSTLNLGNKGDGNKDGKINLIDMSVLHTDWKPDLDIQKIIREGIDMNDDKLINTFDFGLHRNLLIKLGVIKTR